MSRTVCGRWDMGKPPADGAKFPGVDGRRFDGTQFALMFDRRWQFLALWRFAQGIEEEWYHWEYEASEIEGIPTNPADAAEARANILEWGQLEAERFLKFNNLENFLSRSILCRCRSPLEITQTKTLIDVLKMVKDDPSKEPNLDMKADWLVEGCYRWGCKFPTTLTDVYGDICEGANYQIPVGEGMTTQCVEESDNLHGLKKLIKSRLLLPKETWARQKPKTGA